VFAYFFVELDHSPDIALAPSPLDSNELADPRHCPLKDHISDRPVVVLAFASKGASNLRIALPQHLLRRLHGLVHHTSLERQLNLRVARGEQLRGKREGGTEGKKGGGEKMIRVDVRERYV
jgi:hypothetical protein